jgi:hypothetical protein
MKKFWFLVLTLVFSCTIGFAKVVTYPPVPGLVTSKDFKVEVNGQPVWVEKIGSDVHTDKYSLYGGIEMEYLNVANFSCDRSIKIKIIASQPIESYIIRPKSRQIKGEVRGNELLFSISGPQKLYVEINHLAHLAIFANPLEKNPPKEKQAGVLYFGPGNHNPGQLNLESNQTVYIAGGAIVNANVRGNNLQNVKILGRGSLQGNVRISGTSNLEIDGIFIRNTKGWSNTLTNCHHSRYTNVKVFGYEAIYSVDGINPVSCHDFTIDDCFMRCRDDCVAIKSMDYKMSVDSIRVTNCVMVGWACSDGVTIGYELNGSPVRNILVKNCDILYARSGGGTGGHSGFGIVSDGPAWVENIRYENIRVEENIEFKNLEIIITNGQMYGIDPPGHIKGIYMKNIEWDNPQKPFIIQGFSKDNLVEDVTFDHCRVGGRLLGSTGDAIFKINEFTKDIKFIP